MDWGPHASEILPDACEGAPSTCQRLQVSTDVTLKHLPNELSVEFVGSLEERSGLSRPKGPASS